MNTGFGIKQASFYSISLYLKRTPKITGLLAVIDNELAGNPLWRGLWFE
jgi:hypothetical protein